MPHIIPLTENLSEKLYHLRLLTGLSDAEVTSGTGLSRATLLNLEKGLNKYGVQAETLDALARTYHVDVDALLDPLTTAADILPAEYYLPKIAPLITEKTDEQKAKEEEFRSLPPAKRFQRMRALYDLNYYTLANALHTSRSVLFNAATENSLASERTYAALAKAFNTDPLYFLRTREERLERLDDISAKRRSRSKPKSTRYVLDLDQIFPIEQTDTQRELTQSIVDLPAPAERYSRLQALYNLTDPDLCEQVGITPAVWTQIKETGETTADERKRLGKYFGIDPDQLNASTPIALAKPEAPAPAPAPAETPTKPAAAATDKILGALLQLESDSIPILKTQFLIRAAELFARDDYTDTDKDSLFRELAIFYKGAH